jgi:hypothetical protein
VERATLHIRDLCGLARGGLDSVGLSFGFGKIPLDLDGHDDLYWKEHMSELLAKHPAKFEEYAIRDAEITIEAWRSFVDEYKPLNLDPHRKYTCSALAIAAFLRQMKKLPCPTTEEKILGHKWMKAGYWKEYVKKQVVFNGCLDARINAVYAYWGGHNEAFALGYFKPGTEITQWDVKSLYIIAGILQPLSNCDTVYKEVSLEDVHEGFEGFCKVDFEFPPDTIYPTLPIKLSYYDELMFPLRGSSYCTLTEVQQGLTLGARITNFKGFGFKPSSNEINSELKAFFVDMLAKKSALEEAGQKNSSDYMNEKAKLVGMVGKFAQMNEGSTAGDIFHLIHESGLKSEQFRKFGRKEAMRSLYTKGEVGGTWSIEWASLILGRARSIAGWMINQGRCMAISTDGGFWLGNPHLDESNIAKEMVKFHSGIRREDSKKPIDEFWVGRNRGYVAWSDKEPVYVAQGGIAVRGHNREEKKENFAQMIRESVKAGLIIYTEQKTTRLTGFKDFQLRDVPLCSKEHKILKCNWAYDGKRKLDREINIFAENTWTMPYNTVEEAYGMKHGTSKGGRPRGSTLLTEEEIAEIRAAKTKFAHKLLAEKYNVSVATIRRTMHRLRAAQKRPLL